MPANPILIPQPQSLTLTTNSHSLKKDGMIFLEEAACSLCAEQLQQALSHYAAVQWSIGVGTGFAEGHTGLYLVFDQTLEAEAYRLIIEPEALTVQAGARAGLFYGVQTLIQLLRQYGQQLPCLQIQDHPDMAHRGVMLDISRNKVPTMATLFRLIDMFAHLKLNQLQLYTEHTFAYQQHPEIWQQASPMTAEEIQALDSYCQARCVELVPNQNSFGHMHHWLTQPRYGALAEAPDGFTLEWMGHRLSFPTPFSLDPTNPQSLELVDSLWDELLPNFSSRQVNVGLDETFDLGMGKSQALCEEKGKGKVYLNYLQAVHQQVTSRGYRMQYWADIVAQYPELLADLPKDALALEWGYELFHPFEERARALAEAGIAFYVCPGTSSWSSLTGRTDNALQNIKNAAEQGLRYGAEGMLVTDWGDHGHWQQLPISFLGIAYAAALSWAFPPNQALALPEALDLHIFEDRAKIMGQLVYDLGNVYQRSGVLIPGGSFLLVGLILPLDLMEREEVSEDVKMRLKGQADWLAALQRCVISIQELSATMAKAEMQRDDAGLILEELRLSGELLELSCKRLLFILGDAGESAAQLDQTLMMLAKRFEACWLARNREGGLEDSLARLIGKRAVLPVPWQEALNLFVMLYT